MEVALEATGGPRPGFHRVLYAPSAFEPYQRTVRASAVLPAMAGADADRRVTMEATVLPANAVGLTEYRVAFRSVGGPGRPAGPYSRLDALGTVATIEGAWLEVRPPVAVGTARMRVMMRITRAGRP